MSTGTFAAKTSVDGNRSLVTLGERVNLQQQQVISENIPWLQILHISPTQPVNTLLSCGNEFCRLLELCCSLCSRTGRDLKNYFAFLTVHVNNANKTLPSISSPGIFSRFESKVFKILLGFFLFLCYEKGKYVSIYVYAYVCMCISTTAKNNKSCCFNNFKQEKVL